MLDLTATSLSLSDDHVLAEGAGSLLARGLAWLRGEAPDHLVVIGAFGAGKTTFCESLLSRAAPKQLSLVSLGDLNPELDPDAALHAAIGAEAWQEVQRGERSLLLDGLDELPGPNCTPCVQWVAGLLAHAGPRWVLTSRPGHIRTSAAADPDQLDAWSLPSTQLLRIDPLTHDLIVASLSAFARGPDLLRSVDGLEDLAATPLLLHIARAALPYIYENKPIKAWALLDAWLRFTLRDSDDHNEALERLVALAWQSFAEAGHRVDRTHIDPDALRRAALPERLLRALFVHERDGGVHFGHRTFFEHLLASHIAPCICENQNQPPNEVTGIRITDAIRAFLVGQTGPMPVVFDGDRVRIPAGNFVAGGTCLPDERHLRIAHIGRPFWISRTPILRHETQPGRTVDKASNDCPATGLSPEQADALALAAGGRLPTADEWEKAVRGLDGQTWPWGDAWHPGHAQSKELDLTELLPARALGSLGDAALFSAVGGAYELTASYWRGQPDKGRVIMGGSYLRPPDELRPSLRTSHLHARPEELGARIVWDES